LADVLLIGRAELRDRHQQQVGFLLDPDLVAGLADHLAFGLLLARLVGPRPAQGIAGHGRGSEGRQADASEIGHVESVEGL